MIIRIWLTNSICLKSFYIYGNGTAITELVSVVSISTIIDMAYVKKLYDYHNFL